MGVLGNVLDYWRLYEAGVAVAVQSYEEDAINRTGDLPRHLTSMHSLFRLHSLLAHARLIGQETPDVQQVLVRMDWRGIGRRALLRSPTEQFCEGTPVEDRFAKTISLPWGDLRDHYFNCLRRLALLVFGAFPTGNLPPLAERLTRDFVEREFSRFDRGSIRLFDD
jgi:hypothetical protein